MKAVIDGCQHVFLEDSVFGSDFPDKTCEIKRFLSGKMKMGLAFAKDEGLESGRCVMEISMEDQESRKKDRSPNFPFISLETAIDRVRAFYAEERRGAAPVARAAKHWRYSPSSSGLLQTIAALKSYGLMGDEGSGAERRLRLTDMALRVILDTRAESPERLELIRRAALNPSVSSEVHGGWPDGLPSDETLNHYLIFDRGFAPQNASRALKILKENQRLASFPQVGYLSSAESIIEDKNVADAEEDLSQVSDWKWNSSGSPRQVAANPTSPPKFYGGAAAVVGGSHSSTPPLPFTEQILDPDGRAIRIEFAAAPTEEMYEFIKDYIDLRLKVLRRKAAAPTPAFTERPAE